MGQLQDCTHSCGSLWAVWVALLPQWHPLAGADLHQALRTAPCPPYCKLPSPNTLLKPDQELVNSEMEQSVRIKQQAGEVENSAALIFLTVL